MNTVVLTSSLLFLSLSAISQPVAADCVQRVGATQAAIEALIDQNGAGPLQGNADIELTVLLLDLCREPAIGSTNVRSANAEVTTTRGLNPKSEIEEDTDKKKTTFLGLEVEPKGSDARFKRPGPK